MKKRRTFKSTNPNVNLGLKNTESDITKKSYGKWILDKLLGIVFKLSDDNMPAIEQDQRISKYTKRRYRFANQEEINNGQKQ